MFTYHTTIDQKLKEKPQPISDKVQTYNPTHMSKSIYPSKFKLYYKSNTLYLNHSRQYVQQLFRLPLQQ